MSYNLQDLNTKHRAVARYLALGVKLEDICQMYSLNLSSWRQITTSPLFQHEVARVAGELEDRILDDAVKDPVLAQLKAGTLSAVKRLLVEADNCNPEEGANAGTRIRAAESILDRCGYNYKQEPAQNNVIFVALGSEKLDAVLGKKEITAQPTSVQG